MRTIQDVIESSHHFGRPFLTSYQIAIEFKRRHKQVFVSLNKLVGGKGKGPEKSLAQYFANELSKRIKQKTLKKVEGRFLAQQHLNELSYLDDPIGTIEFSSGQNSNLSMFRFVDL